MAVAQTTRTERIDAVRAFNRFHTRLIGVLSEGLLDTPYSLTEARVIFELAQRNVTEVAALRRALEIDAGYLSRILARFEADGLLTREQSAADARRQQIRLTEQGRTAFATLDSRSAEQVAELLQPLDDQEQRRLTRAMTAIRDLLEPAAEVDRAGAIVFRPLGPGDYGWVVQRHGALYAREYGWDETFEALVAHVVAGYVEGRDPERENAWIAELDGEPAGCIFCVRRDDEAAQLRLLLVEPHARGHGIGSGLVEECLAFARRAGYRDIILWTNDVLADARRIYERAGFTLVEEEPHHSFGHHLVGQYWSRAL